MSLIARRALRSNIRFAPSRARLYSSHASEDIAPALVEPTAEWTAQQEALKHHAAGTLYSPFPPPFP